MKSSRTFSLLLAVLVPLSALAQAAAPQQPQRRKVSLQEALQLAARQGPEVAASRAQAAIAAASVKRAWTAWQPDITAVGTFDHTNAASVIPAGSLGPQQTQDI